MLIAYQGIPGAYSEMAVRTLFPGGKTLPCATFGEVFVDVCHRPGGRADCGVIPVENSLAGSIHENYDLLERYAPNVIGETYVRVEHALMAPPGTRLSNIVEVRSHPQALAQCSEYLSSLAGAKPSPWYDTAGAAHSLSESAPAGVAAIASEKAAEIYGLNILKRRIQNRANNYTRFLVIARKGSKIRLDGNGADLKTSLTLIPARNKPGVLHAITGVFAEQGIDLTKIESRPDPENPFDYRFYLDATGGAQEPALKKALADLKKFTRDLRVLGSYPRAALPAKRVKG